MATMDLSATFGGGDTLEAVYQRHADSVRKNPKSSAFRVSLFQMFCVRGEWDRAIAQLGVLNDLSKENELFVRGYDNLIRCERFRQMVFAGERQPLLVGEPEPWIALLLQALALDAKGKTTEAAEVRERAFNDAPASAFDMGDGQVVEWLADADSRFGPMFEACFNGRYYWVPLHRVSRIRVDAPTDLRDLVWVPASITFTSGGEEVAFLPVRYPGSELAADDALKLARRTEWVSLGGDYVRGIGQHMWTAGDRDFPLLDARSIDRVVD
jgi:type VI secretion system protein ImpE